MMVSFSFQYFLLEKNRISFAGILCQTFKNGQFSTSYGRIEMIRKYFLGGGDADVATAGYSLGVLEVLYFDMKAEMKAFNDPHV